MIDEAFHYDKIIVSRGIKVPFVERIITPRIERPLRNSRYEGGEIMALQNVLRDGDVVLELGGGLGLCSAIAALHEGVVSVTTIEANPEMIPMINETHRLNGVTKTEVINAVVSAQDNESIAFYLRGDFWASSMEPESRRFKKIVMIPGISLRTLLAKYKPTVIVCDIEGAELDIFENVSLENVRQLICEVHAKVYGTEGVERVLATLAAHGLHQDPPEQISTVRTFSRVAQS